MEIVINDFVKDASYGHFDEQAPLAKSFSWLTDVVTFDNRTEQRNQTSEFPLRSWMINWQWMDEGARDKVIELSQRAKGMFDFFLYRDFDDQLVTITDWSYTAVTGSLATTQLQQTYYKGTAEEWTEDRVKIQPSAKYAPKVYINAALQTEGVDYTLDDTTGIITWTAPLTPGEVITADYKFYFKVRFGSDVYEDIQHQPDWWATNDLVIVEDVS